MRGEIIEMNDTIVQNAKHLTAKIGGRWHGSYGTGPCPICQPTGRKDQNALTLRNSATGVLLLYCHKSECPFIDILGLFKLHSQEPKSNKKSSVERPAPEVGNNNTIGSKLAYKIWRESIPVLGSPSEAYFHNRNIHCNIPTVIRYHPSIKHSETNQKLPALISKIEGCQTFSIHRTYLNRSSSQKADILSPKMMLGKCAGGAVRLFGSPGPLVVAEGIETALSLGCGLLNFAGSIWAALSSSGMKNLKLPENAGHLVVATDGDDAGRNAGYILAERAFHSGWTVSKLQAPETIDWNDVLRHLRSK